MTVIWGLDLKEIQWDKFKSSHMFGNTDYHLRRTKFGVYQGAMILTVVSESLGTAALSDYINQQNFIAARAPGVVVHNNNFIGIAAYNIFVGVFVATIFGAAFFFDLFWPARRESRGVRMAWRVCSLLSCLFTLSCALAYTNIVATKRAFVSGTNEAEARRLLAAYGGSPMRYASNGRAVASVVFLWPGMVFTFVSAWVMWRSLAHWEKFGPLSGHARRAVEEGEKQGSLEMGDGAVDVGGQMPPTHAVGGDAERV